jgi:hypothetical protein
MPDPLPSTAVCRPAYELWPIDVSDQGIRSSQVWIVTFANDEVEAAGAALLTLPPFYRTLAMSSLSVSSREGKTTWKIAAEYSSSQSKPVSSVQSNVEDPEVSYTLSGETKHITQSLSTRGKTIEGIDVNGTGTITVTDSGAIGVEKDSVKGADILVPVVSFSETHYFLRKDLTRTLRTTWESMFAYTNNSLFRDYAVGEVLFSGVQTTVKGGPDGTVPVTFQFQRRANVKDENVGGIVLDIDGWELVDMRYKPQLNTTSKRTEATPSKVLLHKVYKAGNFGDLGISTT